MAEPVKLENIAAFREALADYQMSEHAQKVLADTRLVILSGIAGGGRNTVINHLVEHYNYYFLVSDTTRPPKVRDGAMERDGVNYYFRDEIDMLHDIQHGEFVEAEIIHNQQVSGTSIRELEKALKSGRTVIGETEFGGAHNIASAKPDVCMIGLLPPSYEEWLRRLQGREEMHADEFRNRLETAEKVLEHMLSQKYFRFVVNEDIAQSAKEIIQIAAGVPSDTNQESGREVAERILTQVKQHIRQ